MLSHLTKVVEHGMVFNGRSAMEETSLVRKNMTHMDHERAVWGSWCMRVCLSACLVWLYIYIYAHMCAHDAATSHAC